MPAPIPSSLDRTALPVTPPGRLSFPQLFEPRSIDPRDPSQKPRFSATLICPPAFCGTIVTELQQMAREALKRKFGTNMPRNPKRFWSRGEDYKYAGYNPGDIILKAAATAENPPTIYDVDGRVLTIDNGGPAKVYAGCWCRFVVGVYAYDRGSQGVSLLLKAVQKLRDDVPFASSRPVSADDLTAATLPEAWLQAMGGAPAVGSPAPTPTPTPTSPASAAADEFDWGGGDTPF